MPWSTIHCPCDLRDYIITLIKSADDRTHQGLILEQCEDTAANFSISQMTELQKVLKPCQAYQLNK